MPVAIDYKLSRDMKTITINPRTSLKSNSSYAVAVDKTLVSTKGSILRKKTLIPFRLSGSFNEPVVSQHEINETPAPAYASNRQNVHNVQNPFAATQDLQTAQLPDPVQVIGLAPQNGSKVTNLTQPITIGFNEDIRPETLNEFTFRLEDDFGPIPAKIHYFENNKQATLTPIGLLDTGKSYKVVVTQGITDKHGRPIRSGITSMFSTASPISQPAMPAMPVMNQAQRQVPQQRNINNIPDLKNETAQLEAFENNSRKMNYNANAYSANTYSGMAQADKTVRIAPQTNNGLTQFKVTSVFPAANADNISRKSKIALHFSEPADPKSINNINISVFANQKRVDGKVIYDRKNNRAIFEPERQLDAKTEYKVIVSNKIQRLTHFALD